MTHAWSTPLPHVYIHGQLHRSVTDSVNHIQLPLMAVTWVTKILINVFRQSRCQTRVKVFVFFYNGDDRNDRNDKETKKSYVRANDRGLWISCHSCHLCHWGEWGVGLRVTDAPLPMEMYCYRQFTWRWGTVNAHRCFSVSFTVIRNLLVVK